MEPDQNPNVSPGKRTVPSASWGDLDLAEGTLQQLRDLEQLAAEARSSSRVGDKAPRRGVIALFIGDAAPAKARAAAALAKWLGADLVTVDLSGVVSQYIGETEKNLRRVFAAAEESAAVLFFDEADALFGKRTDVKDSHDRYQNQEVDYLLQRVEAFAGLVILATNMRDDEALAVIKRPPVAVRFHEP